jgi:hypothetical protein
MKVKGTKFVAVDEKYDRMLRKKEDKSMKTAGVAVALKKASKNKGSKKPGVKGQKKVRSISDKKGEVI